MKKLFLLIIFILLTIPGSADAGPFLVADAPAWVPAVCEVSVNGEVEQGTCAINGSEIYFLDLVAFTTGKYTFKVRWHDGSGWWSEWSNPFDATKPEKPLNVRNK